MSGDALDFNNIETQALINSFSSKTSKEIHDILTETLREHAPPYATAKNWMA